MRLADKVAVITGAAVGIGRSCAVVFAGEGGRVVLADVNEAGGKETAEMVRAKGGEAVFVRADVSSSADAENLMKAAVDKFGRVDVLLNVAAVPQPHMPVEEIDDALWDRVYGVNVKGIFHTMKYAIPLMKAARSGSIINIGALAGIKPPMPNSSALASSKGAVITLTRAVAMEMVPYNIRVNCVNPGGTATPMLKKILENAGEGGLSKPAGTPQLFGRLIEPEEIAYAAVYLASDESLMLTGINIDINGGDI